jgi:hypothetical protein
VSGPSEGPARPRLVPVPPPEGTPLPPAGERTPRRRGDLLAWLLGAALVLFAVGLAVEARRAARLEASLRETEGRLDAAEARLAAYDAYLGAVRDRVGGLRRDLDGLEGVLAADPAEGAPGK